MYAAGQEMNKLKAKKKMSSLKKGIMILGFKRIYQIQKNENIKKLKIQLS
jgi:hypothetical protein